MVLKLRKSECSTSNGLQFGVETREIWLIEAKLCKGHAITGLSLGQIVFGCLGSIFCGNWVHWVSLFSLTLSLVAGLFW